MGSLSLLHGEALMRILVGAIYGALLAGLFMFVAASGVHLMSLTTYPYWQTVGGATIIATVVGAAIGMIVGTMEEGAL